MKLERILLTTDFSDCARGAYAPAAGLARRFGAAIDLVHVADWSPPGAAELVGVSTKRIEKGLEARLREVASDPPLAGLEVNTALLSGGGPEEVARFAAEGGHDLLVAASHGHTGFKHLLLGSFAERLLRSSECPVLTWRGEAARDAPAFRRIFFPHDFSEESSAASAAVRFFATEFGAKVILFHSLRGDVIPAVAYTEGSGFASQLPRFWEEAEEWSREELRKVAEQELAGLSWETDFSVGSPAVDISKRAEEAEADLIILATHGRTGLRHALLGSVAERVARTAPCPVLTVRPPGEGG